VAHLKFGSWIKQNWLVLIVLIILAYVAVISPARAWRSTIIGVQTFVSIGAILLTVFVFMGMFSVWVSKERVSQHLGRESGWKGLAYGTLLGVIYHGPQVSIFPFLETMLDKGAKLSVVVAVVSAFAIKLPMIPLEIALIGLKFTVVHNLLLLITAPILGIVMAKLLPDIRAGDKLND
jgi:uncharacterized membrane protein YraQ (UPF0718 family)